MGDSDEDNDRDYESAINLAGFMFGNIDANGELEDDILDENAKQHLSSLCHLGLGSLLQEMMASDSAENKKVNGEKSQDGNDSTMQNGDVDSDDDDYDEPYVENKDPQAKDFSDITELAEELPQEVSSKSWFFQNTYYRF